MARRPTMFSRAAGALEAAVRAWRGPESTRVADVPGASHYGDQARATSTYQEDRVRNALRSMGAYEARVSPLAGPTQTRFALWPGDALTPQTIITAQRQAVTSGIPLNWIELIDQVYSRDGHYAAVTSQRVEDVIKGTWRLTRAANDDAATATRNFVNAAYQQCSRWRDGLGWLLYSNLFGYSAVEVEWRETRITFPGPRGEPIGPVEVVLPVKLHNVHPKHFRFDIESDDPKLWLAGTFQDLPPGKFIFMDGDGLHPIKTRRGHAWQCIWYSLMRSIGWAAWAVHVERFSLPIPVIEYDGDVAMYNEYQAAWTDILNSIGQGKGAIFPKNSAGLRIENPPSGGTASDPASALSDACDAGQSIRVLGATLTTKIGNVGSFSASSTHAEVKYAKEENDAGRLWERIDEQLSTPLLTFNAESLARALNAKGYNVTPEDLISRVPRGKHRVPREQDPLIEMQVADYAVNKLGLPLSQEGMLDRIDFPRATSDEDRVRGEAQIVSKGGALIPNAKAAANDGVVNPDKAAEKQADTAAKEAAKPEPEKNTPGDGE